MTDRHRTPARCVRVNTDLWNEYAQIVGEDNRSADLRAYIQWRVQHPTATPPHKQTRKSVPYGTELH